MTIKPNPITVPSHFIEKPIKEPSRADPPSSKPPQSNHKPDQDNKLKALNDILKSGNPNAFTKNLRKEDEEEFDLFI